MNTLQGRSEHEPGLPKEIERKFLPAFDLSELLPDADRIEQIYLSWPHEDWNLRVRKTTRPHQEPTFEATLKSRPGTRTRALVRDEINADISEETYRFYQNQNLPRLQKLRAHLGEGITMDWLTDDSGTVQPFVLEVEGTGPDQTHFLRNWESQLIDVSRMAEYDNERTAHALWKNPSEQPALLSSLDVQEHVHHIAAAAKSSNRPIVIGIQGRSGSGKSTLAQEVATLLEWQQDDMPVMRLSTDDYHRGRNWLLDSFGVETWKNWDAPIVYNTAALAFELNEYLEKGEPIQKRHFDFRTQEPVVEAEAHAAGRIVIIEGLFPHSDDLAHLIDYTIELSTPVATSIGRRIMRDIQGRLNDSLGSPEEVLRYQLETAEPTHLLHAKK